MAGQRRPFKSTPEYPWLFGREWISEVVECLLALGLLIVGAVILGAYIDTAQGVRP